MSAAKTVDFNTDDSARSSLLKILDEGARLLEPFEVAWLLSLSISEVYCSIPRVKLPNGSVRFDPKMIKELRSGFGSSEPRSSLKTKKETRSVGLSSNRKKGNIDKWL